LENYWAWADRDGDLWDVISRDHVLTTLTLYWLTRKVLSALGIYDEDAQAGRLNTTTPARPTFDA
jgi:hypothetical protein